MQPPFEHMEVFPKISPEKEIPATLADDGVEVDVEEYLSLTQKAVEELKRLNKENYAKQEDKILEQLNSRRVLVNKILKSIPFCSLQISLLQREDLKKLKLTFKQCMSLVSTNSMYYSILVELNKAKSYLNIAHQKGVEKVTLRKDLIELIEEWNPKSN
jgi:hypothetical protein